MRKITSNFIILKKNQLLKNGILIIDDKNIIVDIIDRKGNISEIENLEYYSGIICPAFVDTLCFLSYPNYKINSETQDIKHSLEKHKQDNETDALLIKKAVNHMDAFGTAVAADFLGDRINTELRKNSKCKIITSNFCSLLSNNNIIPSKELYIYNKLLCSKNIIPTKENINNICLSSGSLNSHRYLSIFKEIIDIQFLNKELNIVDLINMAAMNGARALGVDNDYGSIEIGKIARLNIITNYDIENFQLKKDSKLKVLI